MIDFEPYVEWFSKVIETAIQLYFEQDCSVTSIKEIPLPDNDWISHQIPNQIISFEERVTIILTIMPHLKPQLLDTFFINNKNFDRPFTEFGGLKGNAYGGFLPTGETAAFIISGSDISIKLPLLKLFEEDHYFVKKNILKIIKPENGEPFLSGALQVSTEFLSLITTGEQHRPDYSINFPAKRITTKLSWDDLVLPYSTLEDLEDINTWICNSTQIMNDVHLTRFVKPGYRALFYGPPGTGKTLSVALLGKRNSMDVYRIDLSMLVSKYIGETEKNLANVFDQAENKSWILFFDEADALFGKRTQTNSSNDRHANQEVAYLLQRIEDYPGTVLLATNLKSNIDDAFARRFQVSVYFPMPETDQRLTLWNNMIPSQWLVKKEIELNNISKEYELSGGAITNVIRFCALRLIKSNKKYIDHDLLIEGIKKELRKEGNLT
jgi:ATPase family protein associated with various cellular activities (AAA)